MDRVVNPINKNGYRYHLGMVLYIPLVFHSEWVFRVGADHMIEIKFGIQQLHNFSYFPPPWAMAIHSWSP